MIEYVVKFYNNQSNNILFEEKIHNVDIEKLMKSDKEIDFVIIERKKITDTETKSAQSLVFFNKNKWSYKKIINNQDIFKQFKSNDRIVNIEKNCRTKYCDNKEEILKRLDKIISKFHFINENSTTFEKYAKHKHHK